MIAVGTHLVQKHVDVIRKTTHANLNDTLLIDLDVLMCHLSLQNIYIKGKDETKNDQRKEKKGSTSSRTSISRESVIDAAVRKPDDKHLGIHAGVVTKISGGPANATRCREDRNKSQKNKSY